MIFLCKIKSTFDDEEGYQTLKFVKVANSFDECINPILEDYSRPGLKEHLYEIKIKALPIEDGEILISDDMYEDLNDTY